MKRKFIFFFLCCLALSASLFLYLHYRVAPGLDLSNINLSDKRDKTLLAAQLPKGKGIVIQFFASWCPDCRKEMPDLAQASTRLLASEVLCYAFTDEPLDRISAYTDKFKESDIQFFQLWKPFKTYGINAIPTTYFIKSDGSTVYSKVGKTNWEDLDWILERFDIR
ncbi:MAG: TlpA family protein disulfide reductase [Flavobacteriales bacterium]